MMMMIILLSSIPALLHPSCHVAIYTVLKSRLILPYNSTPILGSNARLLSSVVERRCSSPSSWVYGFFRALNLKQALAPVLRGSGFWASYRGGTVLVLCGRDSARCWISSLVPSNEDPSVNSHTPHSTGKPCPGSKSNNFATNAEAMIL